MPARRARPAVALIAGGALLAAVIVVVVVLIVNAARSDHNPFAGQTLFVDPDSRAARAAASDAGLDEREAAARIAAVPTAIWITPEEFPPGSANEAVADIMASAGSAEALPTFVVYGITDRDCGGFSAGGLPAEAYLDWVDEIAAGLGDGASIVVLEPDSLGLAPECTNQTERTDLVRAALARFGDTAATVYLDAGHSAWLPPERIAELLRSAGVAKARGFATNVSNMQSTVDELEFARQVSAELGGAHAIIDTSRNGAGPPSDGSWCNPPGIGLGETPRAIDDPVVDAVLWVKPPGESDGTCNGGPTAGQWWPEQAVDLVANAVE
ncbi:cellobiohydrolase [Agromyces badenianii]|uniref:Glucanase n=1 Tax=Agromyces badenianii TaxID=2080742 RepID=A0A2S0WXK3_9MICO|nr:glycoside hydrolase family 6 protein [Agromyces badenianii]AWB96031.1 cellobiohydrolase [Agromyces badenianii]PWC04894.1 cellobiohydrolase [Agromyces badenianii]